MLNYKELIEACSGEKKDGTTKCGISISNEFWAAGSAGTERMKTAGSIDLINPVIRLHARDEYVQVDLDFGSEDSPELAATWDLLEEFATAENSASADGSVIPVTILTIAPLEYAGEYSFVGIGPVFWTLQPLRVGLKASVIRMIFNADKFIAQCADPEDIAKVDSLDKIESEKEQTLSDIELYRLNANKRTKVSDEPVEEVEDAITPDKPSEPDHEDEEEYEDGDGF